MLLASTSMVYIYYLLTGTSMVYIYLAPANYSANISCIALLSLLIYYNIFWVSVKSSGFGDPRISILEMDFHLNRGSGFNFGFRFWVPKDFTRSEPASLPSLMMTRPCLVAQNFYKMANISCHIESCCTCMEH